MMETMLPAVFGLGLLSGFRHAFEPDHVAAVSTLLHRDPRLRRALTAGISWGAGHSSMLVVAVFSTALLGMNAFDAFQPYSELPAALLLIVLGGWVLFGMLRRDPVSSAGSTSAHRSGWKGFAVGAVHGLAGSGAFVILIATALPSPFTTAAYVVLFGAGSMAGMAGVTLMLAAPFLTTQSRPRIYAALTGASGVVSLALGGHLLSVTLT